MIDIKNILICPECMSGLTDELVCEECGNIYSYKYGVYDIISQNISKLPYAQQMFLRNYDNMFQDETMEIRVDYTADKLYRNEETTEALRKWQTSMKGLIDNFSGVVCDLATGFGSLRYIAMTASLYTWKNAEEKLIKRVIISV